MSNRIVLTEQSIPFLNTIIENSDIDTSCLRSNRFSNDKFSLKKQKITEMLKQYNPIDEYSLKINNIMKMNKNTQNIQNFLLPKIESNKIPNYLIRKVSHITKIIANSDKQRTQEKNASFNNSIHLNKTIEISSLDRKENSPIKFENQRKLEIKLCNNLLFGENYLERLLQRYTNYLKKNNDIKKQLAHLTNKKPFQKKNSESINGIIDGNEINEFGEKKYFVRIKQRLNDYHKKKYIKVWENNNLPPKGFCDNVTKLKMLRESIKIENIEKTKIY